MFALTPLPYGYDALEPTISEATLRTHHGKHHAKYVENANALLAGSLGRPLETVIRIAASTGDRKLFNNASQAWNHGFFWSCMTPTPQRPSEALLAAIEADFGGIEALKTLFLGEGTGHFGSGWVWLLADGARLSVASTHDADSPLVGGGVPLLVCDVWEHAYYLDHKNDRAAFLAAWWDRLVDWSFVSAQYEAARTGGAAWRYEGDSHMAEAGA